MKSSDSTAAIESRGQQATRGFPRVWLSAWSFLEMMIPMFLGMAIFAIVVRELRASSSFAASIRFGTDLYIIGDALFMTVPMVAWMLIRRHGWRHSLEMGAAMVAPGAAIIVLGQFGAYAYLSWLPKAACPLMCLGMLVYMVFRRDAMTGHTGHAAHAAHH